MNSTQFADGAFDLPPARLLFRSRAASLVWLVVRVWLGWQWLDAGWQKLTGVGYDNWVSHSAGLQGFIATANASWAHRAQAFGHPEMAYPWFLHILNAMDQHPQAFSITVTFSELAVGVGLLLGCLTGVAAAGAVALNFLYITGGSAGVNGVFIVLGVMLIAAWRVAGYFGIDYFLLPLLGTPWEPGTFFRKLRLRRKTVGIVRQAE